MTIEQEMERKTEVSKSEGFQRWLDKPEIQLLLSILPPCQSDQQKDTLKGLLVAAWKGGHDAGQGHIAAAMLERILSKPTRDDSR